MPRPKKIRRANPPLMVTHEAPQPSDVPTSATPLKEEQVIDKDNSNNVKVDYFKGGKNVRVRKGKKKDRIDYLEVELDYLKGGLSYRDLAKKYGVSYQRIGQVGKERDWDKKKKELQAKVSQGLERNLDKMAEQVVENVTDKQVQLITTIKTKHIQESKELIKLGMKHLKKKFKDGDLKDTTALEMVKHGHDTIHSLEGMKKVQPSSQTIVFLPEERTERLNRLLHEAKSMHASSSPVVDGEIVG